MSDIKPFLKLMGFLESSDGANQQHRTIAGGLHEGDTAIGKYGLMPNTIKELAARNSKTELDHIIKQAPNSDIQPLLEQNPAKKQEYVEALAKRVLDKANGDPAVAAAGWLYGHNLSGEEMKAKLEQDPEYKARIENAIMEKHLMSAQDPLALPQFKKEQLFSKIRNRVAGN